MSENNADVCPCDGGAWCACDRLERVHPYLPNVPIHEGPSCPATRVLVRCQHVSPSPWGPTQCALEAGHKGRHAYSPSEGDE